MKERPIIFSAPMVRAILAGTKSQTRRVVKPQPYVDAQGNAIWNGWNYGQDGAGRPLFKTLASPIPSSHTKRVLCPHGRPSDRLWVREAWAAPHANDHLVPRWIPRDARIHYAATEDRGGLIWRSPIFIPRWASRITLEITGIRVERLQDISEADAIAEGCNGGHGSIPGYAYNATPEEHYRHVWESLHGAGSWDANPWVWALAFRRVEGGAA